ncbi:G-patch domain protein [Penicillium manginii]|uniref:G-patch domain protein n=1 Tax=Penicillium manginii TaxID=203109 RepID=UPI002546DB48|nr:G-patch domain protein [Penicillium manginii]KAJ5768111.1 G-patch domain protein [Penicillium manginii]
MVHPYEDTRQNPGPQRRAYPPRDDRDGRMYDDRSRSRSPGGTLSSPHEHDKNVMCSESQGYSGTPQRHDNRRREYSDNWDARAPPHNRDQDDHRRRPSRSPQHRGRQSYRDRDREGYRSPGYSQSRSRSRSARRGGSGFGRESKEIMMDGIPQDMSEDDVSAELKQAYHITGLEEIRVIRDRQTKISRGLGFLRFRTIDYARDFLERSHPCIYLYGPTAGENDRSTKVRIAYSREREDRTRSKGEGDWTCRMCAVVNFSTRAKCFRCNAPRPELGPVGPPGVPAPKVVNNGDNDAAPENQPSQFILIRGLEGSVNEDLLAKGVAKLYRPAGGNSDNATNTQKKAGKVASTTGDANLGAREGSIRRVLLVRDRRTNESWRYGFAEFANVMDAQAAIQRLNSFDKFTISSRPVLVSYIHAGVFVPVMDPHPSTEHFTFSPLANPSLKLMYWDDEGYVTELMLSSPEDDVGYDQTKSDKTVAGQDEGQSKGQKDMEKVKKRKADAPANANAKKLAMPSHLQFWSNRHAELHGIPKDSDGNIIETSSEPRDQNAPPTQSYADLNRNCCYLCMRQFKSTANVNRHERLSALHRENLRNEQAKSRGMGKLIKHGIVPPTAEYRDRARERRKAFGRGGKAGTGAGAARPKPSAPQEEDEPPVQTTSKGASLLSKMGWSAGSGLGAQGTGVTAPIATEVYAQGVGLGAQGSKLGDASEEAARNTRGRYDEFLRKNQSNCSPAKSTVQ